MRLRQQHKNSNNNNACCNQIDLTQLYILYLTWNEQIDSYVFKWKTVSLWYVSYCIECTYSVLQHIQSARVQNLFQYSMKTSFFSFICRKDFLPKWNVCASQSTGDTLLFAFWAKNERNINTFRCAKKDITLHAKH